MILLPSTYDRRLLPARCAICRSTVDITITAPQEFLRNAACSRCGRYEIDPTWFVALNADDNGMLRRAVYAYVTADQSDQAVPEVSVRRLGAPPAFLPVTAEFA